MKRLPHLRSRGGYGTQQPVRKRRPPENDAPAVYDVFNRRRKELARLPRIPREREQHSLAAARYRIGAGCLFIRVFKRDGSIEDIDDEL